MQRFASAVYIQQLANTLADRLESAMQLLNPSTLYDPSPNSYSQITILAPGTRLAFISGQGGDNPDGSFSPDFRVQAAQRTVLGGHHPAATLIPVPCLALPQMQIEVEAVVALTATRYAGSSA